MKKKVHLVFLITCCLICNTAVQAQRLKPLAQKVSDYRNAGMQFIESAPLSVNVSPVTEMHIAASAFASKATFAKLDKPMLQKVFSEKPYTLQLNIPYHDNQNLALELVQADIFADGFKVSTQANENEPYTPGVHYRGIVKGDENSLAAISIFDGEIMGIISTEAEGNINIGRYTGASATVDDYIVYADKDVLVPHETTCSTSDAAMPVIHDAADGDPRTTNIVQVYIESDYQLYQNKSSSVTLTSDYLTGIFNESATIFENDGISMEISELFIWTSADGYTSSSSFLALDAFIDYRTTFNGDVAHLVALDANNGGVAATINGFCTTTGKYCYSDVDASYSTYPTYSWTVMVFTHELGHIFGSHHTHWCGWSGGAIDNCGPSAGYGTEGGCAAGPTPTGGGTIMSYCHLTVGINFSNGFGTQPADAIIDAVESASCLGGGTPGAYCASAGTSSSSQWIDFVKVGSIQRTSASDGGYYDATGFTNTNLKQGIAKTLRVSAGMSGGAVTVNWKGWIDWNQDFDFDDAGEEILDLVSSATSKLSVTFTTPTTATLGTTRMRISMKNGGAPTSCETFSLGEVEDYTVTVLAALPPETELATAVSDITVYPNPANETFTVNCTGVIHTDLDITVFDAHGNLVLQQSASTEGGIIIVGLQDVPAGLYLVRTNTTTGYTKSHSLIVE
jgi:hypothetical protein